MPQIGRKVYENPFRGAPLKPLICLTFPGSTQPTGNCWIGSECLFVRFALESGRITKDFAKPKLFEPNKGGELSVFDVVGLSCCEKCKLGIPVAMAQNKRLYGWAMISCEQIREVGLLVDLDNNPPRHANVRGWPIGREDRKAKQQELASLASVVKLLSPATACTDCAQLD